MKNGWLVVNTFVSSDKFKNLYKMLQKSFSNRDISLEIKTAEQIGTQVGLCISQKPDFVLFWDKDIYLAQRLESLGIKLFNSSRSIELCDNKILMYQELEKSGITIPRTFIAPKTFEGLGYTKLSFLEDVARQIGFPLVIKEAYGSFGQQVYLVHNFDEAKAIIDSIGFKDFLMQEFVSSSFGKDVRINVVGGKAVVSMVRENKTDFRSNISNGGTGTLFSPNDDFLSIAEAAAKALQLDFAGVDVLFGENDKPIICELNSNPQFKSAYDATGIDLSENIADYISKTI